MAHAEQVMADADIQVKHMVDKVMEQDEELGEAEGEIDSNYDRIE